MRALTLLCLMPAFVSAQEDPGAQWAPPPQAPKPPVLPTPAPTPTPAPVPAPVPAPAAGPSRPPPAATEVLPSPRRFTLGHVALALMGAIGRSTYFAVRIEAGAVFVGWPTRMADDPERAQGPTLGLALDLLAAKISVGACGSAGICGSRYQGGLALRGAYNWGVIGGDGVVAPVHSVFAQAVPFLSSNSVPSAPLVPGSLWGEHGVRFDVGLTSGFLRGSTWPSSGTFVIGGGVYFALSLEWLIVNTDDTGRFRFAISAGVGL
jgi:hypothetical protein